MAVFPLRTIPGLLFANAMLLMLLLLVVVLLLSLMAMESPEPGPEHHNKLGG